MTHTHDKIIATFRASVRTAYKRLYSDYRAIGRDTSGGPCLPSVEETDRLIRRAIGRCGAAVGAAVKVAKRALIVDALASAKSGGMDITPTIANNISSRLLDRKVDTRALAQMFGTPGRTAADKSTVRPEHTAELEQQLNVAIEAQRVQLQVIKEAAREAWSDSPERRKILADWSAQRKHE